MGPQPGVRSDGCLYYTAYVLHSVQSTLQSMGGAATFRIGLPCSVKHLHRPTQNCISAMILNLIKLSVLTSTNNTPCQCDMPTHDYLCFSLLFVFVYVCMCMCGIRMCVFVCVHISMWGSHLTGPSKLLRYVLFPLLLCLDCRWRLSNAVWWLFLVVNLTPSGMNNKAEMEAPHERFLAWAEMSDSHSSSDLWGKKTHTFNSDLHV